MTSELRQTIRTLWKLLPAGDGWRIALLVAMMLFGAVLEMIGVGIIPVFVTMLSDPESVLGHERLQPLLNLSGVDDTRGLLLAGAILLLSVFVVKNIYIMGYHYLEARYIWNRYNWLASSLFRIYMQAPYTFHRQKNSASLLRNITEESRFLVQEVLGPILRLTMNTLLVTAIFLLLLALEPLITLGALLIIGGGGTLFLQLLKKRITSYGEQAHDARLNIIRRVNEALEGIKDIRVLRREPSFIKEVEEHVKRYSSAQTFWITSVNANKPVIETVAVIGIMAIALLLWVQGRPVPEIVPVLALFGAATVRLLPDVKQMLHQINNLRYFHKSVVPVSRDLRLAEQTEREEMLAADENRAKSVEHGGNASEPGANPLERHSGALGRGDSDSHRIRQIRFESVSYHYPDADDLVIRDVSLEIPGGSFTGFAGPSGGGKTTLADLLLGLLKPGSGRITINDQPLDYWLKTHPESVGYIPQTIFLSDDTLRRNIALGIPDEQIDEEKLQRSITAAWLGDVVNQLTEGSYTVIGERGIRLSGGQRQRIGIARALYHNPALIVMDEATSALDHATESEVMTAVEQLRDVRTVIIIAHRLSTVRSCDLICYLEDGRITDRGTFNELADRHAAFRNP